MAGHAAKPRQDVLGHRPLVADIAAQDQIPAAVGAHDVGSAEGDFDSVRRSVQRDRGTRQRVNLGCLDRCRSRQRTGDGGDAASGGEIEHAPAGNARGLVQHVARQRLAARPCERPERRFHVVLGQPRLGGLPDRGDFAGHVQGDLGDQRHLTTPRMFAHEDQPVSRGVGVRQCLHATCSHAVCRQRQHLVFDPLRFECIWIYLYFVISKHTRRLNVPQTLTRRPSSRWATPTLRPRGSSR